MAEEFVKKVAESPARMVAGTTDMLKKLSKGSPIRVVQKYWGKLGPGLTTGASGDDPSGITAYSQVGATYGFQYLWLSLYTLPAMIVVQEMCARIAQVTGKGLAGVMKQHYSPRLVRSTVGLLFIANTISIAADIGAMAAVGQLLFPGVSFTLFAVLFTILSLFLQIHLNYAVYANFLKYLTLILFAYVITAFFVKTDWSTIAVATLVPSITFNLEHIVMITAVVGATVSPYLLFWQASQEVESDRENAAKPSDMPGTTKAQIAIMRNDVSTGMIFSNVIMFFIIVVTGAILFPQGIAITSAAQAADALRPFAGDYARILFAAGVIGTGLLAMPILAGSASYALSEAYSMREGMNKSLKQAYGFYGVIIIAMLIGLGINFLGIDPIKALIFAAIINGIVTPILVTFILLVGNNQKVMGVWKNGAWSNVLGWTTAILMYIAAIITIYSFFV